MLCHVTDCIYNFFWSELVTLKAQKGLKTIKTLCSCLLLWSGALSPCLQICLCGCSWWGHYSFGRPTCGDQSPFVSVRHADMLSNVHTVSEWGAKQTHFWVKTMQRKWKKIAVLLFSHDWSQHSVATLHWLYYTALKPRFMILCLKVMPV